jgi:hypothetical protein
MKGLRDSRSWGGITYDFLEVLGIPGPREE